MYCRCEECFFVPQQFQHLRRKLKNINIPRFFLFFPCIITFHPDNDNALQYGNNHCQPSAGPKCNVEKCCLIAGMSISVVDYLLACAVQAVERWNSSRGVGSSTITAALTVNMNGRFQKIGGVNNDSVLYFPSGPEQIADLSRLGKWIARSRMRQFRRHMDVKYATGMEKLNNFLRVLPFAARRQMYVRLLQRHQTSFALGFLGVLWPETNGRTMTGESYLTSAGGLEITEVHGMAYKIFSRTPLYLSAYFFRKRLNIVLSAAAWNFTKEESQDFLGLVVDLLEGP